jgi:hypothetical protein
MQRRCAVDFWFILLGLICSFRNEILSSIICCKVTVVATSLSISGEAKLQMVHYKMVSTERRGSIVASLFFSSICYLWEILPNLPAQGIKGQFGRLSCGEIEKEV